MGAAELGLGGWWERSGAWGAVLCMGQCPAHGGAGSANVGLNAQTLHRQLCVGAPRAQLCHGVQECVQMWTGH